MTDEDRAPWLAAMALEFSSFEYFWLVVLGLSAAVAVVWTETMAVPYAVIGLLAFLAGFIGASVLHLLAFIAHPRGWPFAAALAVGVGFEYAEVADLGREEA